MPALAAGGAAQKKPRGGVRNAPGRAKPFRVELAFALGKQQTFVRSSFSRRGGQNTFVRSPTLRLGDENTFVRSLLSRWGSDKHLFVPHFRVAADKIQMFVPRFRVGERKYICSLPAFASGRRKYICSVAAFAVGNENTFVRCPLLRRGSSTRTSFRKKCFGTSKTFPGAAHFCAGEAPPERVFVKITPGRRKPFRVMPAFAPGKLHPDGFLSKMLRDKQNLSGWCPLSRWGSSTRTGFRKKRGAFCPSQRVFRQNAGRFLRLGVFSAKTRGVFLVSACFLPKRGTFSSSRRVFYQNAPHFARSGVFSAKTRRVFLVSAHFPRKRRLRLSKPPATDVCRAVAPARRGRI